MVVRPRGEDEVLLLAETHRVPDLQVAVRALVGEVGDDNLRALDEADDLAFEQVALVVTVHALGVQPRVLDRGHKRFVANHLHRGVAELHDEKSVGHRPIVELRQATTRPRIGSDPSAHLGGTTVGDRRTRRRAVTAAGCQGATGTVALKLPTGTVPPLPPGGSGPLAASPR